MQYYLWSRIKNCSLPIGSEVNQGILTENMGKAMKDEDFAHMIDSGAIRLKAYPVPSGYPGSPRQYYLDSIQAVSGDRMDQMAAILALAEFEAEIDEKAGPAIIGAEGALGAVIESASGPSPDAQQVMSPPGS